jgi:hypothetical protein
MKNDNISIAYVKEIENELINLYFEIKMKTLGQNLNFEEEKENLGEVNLTKVIHYIKESIDILTNMKIEENLKLKENEFNNQIIKCIQCGNKVDTMEEYEKIIRKLEGDIRNHIKLEYQMKLHNEYLEGKIENSDGTDDKGNEINLLRKKLEKYEKKIKIDDFSERSDKKENEILILRAENANLKSTIKNLEIQILGFEDKINVIKKQNEKEIFTYQQKIEKLSKKISPSEELKINLGGHESLIPKPKRREYIDEALTKSNLFKQSFNKSVNKSNNNSNNNLVNPQDKNKIQLVSIKIL